MQADPNGTWVESSSLKIVVDDPEPQPTSVLRFLRIVRGWTLDEAAANIACSSPTWLAKFERRLVEPQKRLRRAIEATYGVPWSVLRTDVPEDVLQRGGIASKPVAGISRPVTRLEILRRLRWADMTRAAAAIGVTRDVLRKTELRLSRPSPPNRKIFERAFGLSLDQLTAIARVDVLTDAVVRAAQSASPEPLSLARPESRKHA